MNANDNSSTRKQPMVGIAVFVWSRKYSNCILLGKRKGTVMGSGLYQLPGGHLENGEDWIDCGARETLEETNLKLKNCKYECVTNGTECDTDYHYITIFISGELDESHSTEPVNTEPHKNEEWFWCDWNQLPPTEEIFYCLKIIIKQGFNPFEEKPRSIFGSSVAVNATPRYDTSSEEPDKSKRPHIGVGVFVTSSQHPGCVLLGRRKGEVKETGLYQLPGGSLEMFEDHADCAAREVMEETGLKLKTVSLIRPVNAYSKAEDRHYLDIVVHGELDVDFKSEPENSEPDRCEGWFWCKWEDLPPRKELFFSLQLLLEEGFEFSDIHSPVS